MVGNRVKRAGLAAVLAAALGILAFGQGGQDELEQGKRWLALMNAKGDTDGTVSKAEFDRYMNAQFDKADADHDGTLSAVELGRLKTALTAK